MTRWEPVITPRKQRWRDARQRAIMMRRFPCQCRGVGCILCNGVGHLSDRSSYAQTVNLRPSAITHPIVDDLPWD